MPSREMVTPGVLYTITPAHSLIGRLRVTRWPVDLWVSPTLSKSISRVLAHLAIQVTFCPFRTLRQELVHSKDAVPANRRKGVVYSYLHWPNGWVLGSLSSRTPLGSEKRWPRVLCSCWACVLLEPSSGSIEGQGDLHPQPHPDSLHAWVLGRQAPPSPLDRERGTLPVLYAALLTWPCIHLVSSQQWVVAITRQMHSNVGASLSEARGMTDIGWTRRVASYTTNEEQLKLWNHIKMHGIDSLIQDKKPIYIQHLQG